jgi:hypothetical protein
VQSPSKSGRPFHSQADEDAAIQIQLLVEIRDLLKATSPERPTAPVDVAHGVTGRRGRRKKPDEQS